MESITIKLSLAALVLCFLLSCSNGTNGKTETIKAAPIQKDSCSLNTGAAETIELSVGFANCHTPGPVRKYPEVPRYAELSATDSLKLSNFIFKTKHKGLLLSDTSFQNHQNKAIDRLNECERRNLIHYIKNFKKVSDDLLTPP